MKNIHFSSKSNEWETPQYLFDRYNDRFNFTLDVCASAINAKCVRFFDKEENGLLQDWSKDRCWMNPPYGREIGKWIEKAWLESVKGALVVCLIPARTDTRYWHDFIFNFASDIRYLRGRIKFKGAKHFAPFPSAIVIFDGRKNRKE